MAGAGNASAGNGPNACSILSRLGLRPLTKCNLVKFYVPALGVASQAALGIHAMIPSVGNRIMPRRDIGNCMLFVTLAGTGAYIYTREHMKEAPTCMRVMSSVTGSALLTLGYILLCSILRLALPSNATLLTVTAIGSELMIMKVGTSYFNYIDGQVVKK